MHWNNTMCLLLPSTEAFGAMCAPRSRGREKRKMMCKRLQFVCQWRQRGCQSPRSPQMLKIGALNEGLCFEEAILMERLAACFLKWLCWHEGLLMTTSSRLERISCSKVPGPLSYTSATLVPNI